MQFITDFDWSVELKLAKLASMENAPIDVLNALMDSDPEGYDVIMQFITDFDWSVESDFKTYLQWTDLKKYKLFDLIYGFAECAIESAHYELIAKLDLSPLNVNYDIVRSEKYYIKYLGNGLFKRKEGRPLFHFINRIILLIQMKCKAGTINEETARKLVSFWINGPFAVDPTMHTVIVNVLCGVEVDVKSDDYNDRWTETIHVMEYPPAWMIEQLLMWFNSDDFESHLGYARFATVDIFNSLRWSKYSPIDLTGLILHAKLNKSARTDCFDRQMTLMVVGSELSNLLIEEYRRLYKPTDCPKFDITLNYLQIVPLDVNFDRNRLKYGLPSWKMILAHIDSIKKIAENSKNLRDNIYKKLGGLMATTAIHATPDTGERASHGLANNARYYIERDFENYVAPRCRHGVIPREIYTMPAVLAIPDNFDYLTQYDFERWIGQENDPDFRRYPDHAEFLRNMPDLE